MSQGIELKVGDIFEDCSYHPVVCTEVDIDGDNICGKSLIDGSEPRSCSLRHCGVRKLTREEADHKVAVFKASGERGLMRLAGWTEESIDEFMRKWR